MRKLVIIPTYNEKENIERIYVRLHSLNMKMALSINVQSVEERSGMAMIWSFGSAQNVTEIMSIVTNIYLRMSM